jgi:hypothetical protein
MFQLFQKLALMGSVTFTKAEERFLKGNEIGRLATD